jgi:RNA recognition motif-containing protein
MSEAGNKLFVGNLPYSMGDEDLGEMFAQAGTVTSAHIMMDKMTGRSRGFGFVEMSSDDEAQKAIELTNGAEVDGRAIVVNIARPREERPPRRDFGGSRGPRREGGYNSRRDF